MSGSAGIGKVIIEMMVRSAPLHPRSCRSHHRGLGNDRAHHPPSIPMVFYAPVSDTLYLPIDRPEK